MTPKLIFAVDTDQLDHVNNLVREAIQGGVDIIEVGTPLIKKNGLNIVDLLHKKYPTIPIYADLKMMDFPEMEIIDYFVAGSSFVSVMAFSNNQNILKAFAIAKSHDKKIFVSLMGYPECDIKRRVKSLSELGTEYIIAHGSGETEDAFNDLKRQIELINPIDNIKLIVAGGINELNIDSILRFQPEIIIIGRGISKQKDITSAIIRIKERILNYQNNERRL